jgi:pyruvate dehydrogenase E2 component (dihydrolipoamide acetyltransferase)
MPSAVCIPRLGWNMDEGVFLGWLRASGEPVRAGDPIFSLEGEKAAQEVEADEDGVLWIDPDGPRPGAVVAVGAVVGAILRPGEGPPTSRPAPMPAEAAAAVAPAPSWVAASNARVRDPGRPRSSPLARRIARELGLDWTTLRGSGRDGRVRKADVLAAASSPRPAAPAASPARSIPVGPRRRAIAARMVESRQATAPVTLTTTVDASNLVNLRDQFRAAGPDPVPAYTDFLARLAALALRDHPLLNARWAGDRIELADGVHVGLAVDAEAGLVVPVIRDADALGLRALAARSRDLIARARAGTLKADEARGGTFTITNLGGFGIETFTPLINPPECAILGLGRIAREPVVVGERVEPRPRLPLSLTFDHRVVDGAPAARFLQDLGRRIENPGPWLLS